MRAFTSRRVVSRSSREDFHSEACAATLFCSGVREALAAGVLLGCAAAPFLNLVAPELEDEAAGVLLGCAEMCIRDRVRLKKVA